jgi:hypothetical protein
MNASGTKKPSASLPEMGPYLPAGAVRGCSGLIRVSVLVALLIAASVPICAFGATTSQQQKDEAECSRIAVQSSGYDPAHPPVVPVATPAPVTGSGARVRGAAAGAAIGAIGGNDVGNAAAKGAVAGGIVRRNRNRAAAAQQNQSATQQQQAGASAYASARQACLAGRGYQGD